MRVFQNEPVLELRRAPVRDDLLGALGALEPRLPLRVPVLVGEHEGAHSGIESSDPGTPSRIVAVAGTATATDAAAAVAEAERGFRAWGARSAGQRAAVLSRAAGLLRS